MIAGTGTTILIYSESGVTVNLATDTATAAFLYTSDLLIGIADAVVAGNNDTLIGASAGHDILAAGGGTDVLIQATGAANTLLGGSGTSTLMASGSADTLIDGSGATTMVEAGTASFYQFGVTGGQATIVNGSSAKSTTSNELDFGPGIADTQLWFQRSGNDLQIDLMGTSSSIDVSNWFAGATNQLQEIAAGGLKIDSQVAQLVQAMATYSVANPSFNPLTAAPQVPNDSNLQGAIAAAWHP